MEHRVKLLSVGWQLGTNYPPRAGCASVNFKENLKPAVFQKTPFTEVYMRCAALQFLLELRGLTVMHGVLNPGPFGEAGTNQGKR